MLEDSQTPGAPCRYFLTWDHPGQLASASFSFSKCSVLDPRDFAKFSIYCDKTDDSALEVIAILRQVYGEHPDRRDLRPETTMLFF